MPSKFPAGDADMKALVDRIHAAGLKAQLWWAPLAADPGSRTDREHPDWLLRNEDGSPRKITWWDSNYLCPALGAGARGRGRLRAEGARRVGLRRPQDRRPAPERRAALLQPGARSRGARGRAPRACRASSRRSGTRPRRRSRARSSRSARAAPPTRSSRMPYLNMVVASDPESSWQVRLKGKTLKALAGRRHRLLRRPRGDERGRNRLRLDVRRRRRDRHQLRLARGAREEGQEAPADARAGAAVGEVDEALRREAPQPGRVRGRPLRHRLRPARGPRGAQGRRPLLRVLREALRRPARAARPGSARLPRHRLRERPRPRPRPGAAAPSFRRASKGRCCSKPGPRSRPQRSHRTGRTAFGSAPMASRRRRPRRSCAMPRTAMSSASRWTTTSPAATRASSIRRKSSPPSGSWRKQAHAAGNRAFVYIAGTECITKDADKSPHTLAKDHPDWLQRKLSGEPASFTSGAAFWIAKGDEDVWISPYAKAWREQYMDARAPDRGHGHRRHLRGHSLLDDPLRRLGGLLGELRRLHRGGLPPEDRPRCPPRPEARRFRGSAFPPMDRFPHRDHHRVHARDRPKRQVGQPEDHDHPRDLSGYRARGGGGRRGRLRAVPRDRCHRPRVRVRRRRPHGDLAHAPRLVPLPGGHALLPRLRRGKGHLDPQLLLGRGQEHRSAGADDEPRHVPGDGRGELLGRGHPRDVGVQRPAHAKAHLRVDREAREDALRAARAHPSDRRLLLAERRGTTFPTRSCAPTRAS